MSDNIVHFPDRYYAKELYEEGERHFAIVDRISRRYFDGVWVEDCVIFTETKEEAQTIIGRLLGGESVKTILDELVQAL